MFWGFVLIFVGTVLMLERFGVIPWGLGTLWPAILILLGLSILANSVVRRRRHW